jgi:hypothetical protein
MDRPAVWSDASQVVKQAILSPQSPPSERDFGRRIAKEAKRCSRLSSSSSAPAVAQIDRERMVGARTE